MARNRELTTQETAELLGALRPYLIRLLDQGTMTHAPHADGTHRRIRLDDLMRYKAERDAARDQTLVGTGEASIRRRACTTTTLLVVHYFGNRVDSRRRYMAARASLSARRCARPRRDCARRSSALQRRDSCRRCPPRARAGPRCRRRWRHAWRRRALHARDR